MLITGQHPVQMCHGIFAIQKSFHCTISTQEELQQHSVLYAYVHVYMYVYVFTKADTHPGVHLHKLTDVQQTFSTIS